MKPPNPDAQKDAICAFVHLWLIIYSRSAVLRSYIMWPQIHLIDINRFYTPIYTITLHQPIKSTNKLHLLSAANAKHETPIWRRRINHIPNHMYKRQLHSVKSGRCGCDSRHYNELLLVKQNYYNAFMRIAATCSVMSCSTGNRQSKCK